MDTMDLIGQARAGDKMARERLIKENMGLVYSIVKRFVGRGYELEDLVQIGSIGLMKAIDKFNLDYDVKFSTYAVPMITGEIKRFLRDDGMIKVSRSLKELALKEKICRERMMKKLGREPTIKEIANQLEVTTEELALALEAGTEAVSLNQTIFQGDGSAICLMDRMVDQVDAHEQLINRVALQNILKALPAKERELIYYRYYQEETQTEIAKKLGISQVQVSRLEKKILRNLRQEFE